MFSVFNRKKGGAPFPGRSLPSSEPYKSYATRTHESENPPFLKNENTLLINLGSKGFTLSWVRVT